jgi:galacturan 1,4-alpha-galacturonidase
MLPSLLSSSMIMKFCKALCLSLLAPSAFAFARPEPAFPISSIEWLQRRDHQHGGPNGSGHNRHVVTIRSSKNDTDDVSDNFLHGIKKANKGGTLYLEKGSTYVVGKKLDLSFLDDIHVHLDGEIKVRLNQRVLSSLLSKVSCQKG